MAEINWTVEAERWLRDIYGYISATNPRVAAQVVEGIYEKVQLLRQFPELGYRYDRHSTQHIRILLCYTGITGSPISLSPMIPSIS
jgi:plasmid stabilization system protein ParE